ncbi:TPA: hypothetical protein ACI5GD_002018 [Streptococcus pneumoniae]
MTIYIPKKHYDFIKTDEARDIFLNLEKKKWLIEEYGVDEDSSVLEHFSFDEEKRKIVENFCSDNAVCKKARKLFKEQLFSYAFYNPVIEPYFKREERFLDMLKTKNEIDPEYIYEKWQVEKEKFFDQIDLVCLDEDSIYDTVTDFILATL